MHFSVKSSCNESNKMNSKNTRNATGKSIQELIKKFEPQNKNEDITSEVSKPIENKKIASLVLDENIILKTVPVQKENLNHKEKQMELPFLAHTENIIYEEISDESQIHVFNNENTKSDQVLETSSSVTNKKNAKLSNKKQKNILIRQSNIQPKHNTCSNETPLGMSQSRLQKTDSSTECMLNEELTAEINNTIAEKSEADKEDNTDVGMNLSNEKQNEPNKPLQIETENPKEEKTCAPIDICIKNEKIQTNIKKKRSKHSLKKSKNNNLENSSNFTVKTETNLDNKETNKITRPSSNILSSTQSFTAKSNSSKDSITRGDQVSTRSHDSEKSKAECQKLKKTEKGEKHQEMTENEIETKELKKNLEEFRKTLPLKERKWFAKHSSLRSHFKPSPRKTILPLGLCDMYYNEVVRNDTLFTITHGKHPKGWISNMSFEEFVKTKHLPYFHANREFKYKSISAAKNTKSRKKRCLHKDSFPPDDQVNSKEFHGRSSTLNDCGSSLNSNPENKKSLLLCTCKECTSRILTRGLHPSVRNKWFLYGERCTCHIPSHFIRKEATLFEDSEHLENNFETEKVEDQKSAETVKSADEPNGKENFLLKNKYLASSTLNIEKLKKTSTAEETFPNKLEDDLRGLGDIEHPRYLSLWEREQWNYYSHLHLLKKRRKRALYMGMIALVIITFLGLIAAIIMIYLRRKVL